MKLLSLEMCMRKLTRSDVFALQAVFLCLSSAMAVVDFENEVWPILKERCIECHQAPHEQGGRLKSPKAGLRLDGAAHIMRGGDDGPVLKVDHPSQSSLYNRVALPQDDDERMPPKGDPLSLDEKEKIRKWIAQGGDFGTWVGAVDGVRDVADKRSSEDQYLPAHLLFYQKLSGGLSPLPDDLTGRIGAETGLLIRPIGISSPLLEARAVSGECGDESMRTLLPLRNHLAKLDLRGANLEVETWGMLGEFPRLVSLNLRQSSIDDLGLRSLGGLKNLRSLNLVQTKVTDLGIKPLLDLPALQSLHLWESGISKERIEFLENRLEGVLITH